jgi:hypothetical protein
MELDSSCVLFDTKILCQPFMKTLAGMTLDWIALGNIKPKVSFIGLDGIGCSCVLVDTKDIVLAFYEKIGWDGLGLDCLG